MASESLFRLGFATDLVAFLCDLVISILLYVLLKPVGKTLSLNAAGFRLLTHPAIASINLLTNTWYWSSRAMPTISPPSKPNNCTHS